MIAEGLLWFDDDPRRPLAEKIANAIARYGERTGWQATVCEAHPTQVDAFNADMARAAMLAARRRAPKTPAPPAVTLPAKLRVMPNTSLRPNYFLIGVEAGERPRKAVPQPTAAAAQRKQRRAEAGDSASVSPAAPPATAPARDRSHKERRAKAS